MRKKRKVSQSSGGGVQATLVITEAAETNLWLLDSGASQHFCRAKGLLQEAKQASLQYVSLADGSTSLRLAFKCSEMEG